MIAPPTPDASFSQIPQLPTAQNITLAKTRFITLAQHFI